MIRSTALPFPPRGRAKSSASVVMVGGFCSRRLELKLSARRASADTNSAFRQSSLFSSSLFVVSACRHHGVAVSASPLVLTGVGTPTPAAELAPDQTFRNTRLTVSARRHLPDNGAAPCPARPSTGANGTRQPTKVHPTPS